MSERTTDPRIVDAGNRMVKLQGKRKSIELSRQYGWSRMLAYIESLGTNND